ncbi:MAG: hypothetical protein PHW52_03990 [Candidatus Pacebacteria bacterium]|nr:hypothetical protein [Candidatus Paceibacterota bacterium]
MEKFNIIRFIEELVSLGERQGERETEAAKLITDTLSRRGVDFSVQEFKTDIPQIRKAQLSADGKDIGCRATCFVSGSISGKDNLVSSLIPSRYLIDYPNINFNPSSEVISSSNHYFAPSVSVSKNDLPLIMAAKEVSGCVEVDRMEHGSVNILVGNRDNPKRIYIAHYDSIELGAIDNGSGVGVLMGAIMAKKDDLDDDLYVFSGNEELSYDHPTYWGHGFRAFEKEYREQMTGARRIIVVDCVGNAKTNISEDDHIRYLAFPIENLDALKEKIMVIHGDMESLMEVYHSKKDDISLLEESFLDEAVSVIDGIDK